KFCDQVHGRANNQNVVKGKRFAVQLFEITIKIAVERSMLVRIFAITQFGDEGQRKGKRGFGNLLAVEVITDCAVVIGSLDESFDCEELAHFKRRLAIILAHFLKYNFVISRVDYYRDRLLFYT